jgi:hypothetical protein
LNPVRSLALAAIVVLLAGTAQAEQAGFAFLEIPAGARAAALGGAYSAVATGAEAAFWNPAGLAKFKGTQFTATHTETYENLRHEHVAIAGRMWGGGLAVSLRALYTEPIEERDELGNLLGTFGSHDLEFLAGYGWQPSAALSLGFTGQFVRERIADLGATTWGVGGGAVWAPATLEGLRASAGIHNLGPAGHYMFGDVEGQPVPLPTALHAGLSYKRNAFQNLTALVSLEGRATSGRPMLYAVGGELDSPVGAALRFGYRANDDVASWSAGLGWRTSVIGVDYAYVPSKLDLDATHRFTLSAQF